MLWKDLEYRQEEPANLMLTLPPPLSQALAAEKSLVSVGSHQHFGLQWPVS